MSPCLPFASESGGHVTLAPMGAPPMAGLFKCNPSNISAAFYTISTDSVLARFLCISRASCSFQFYLNVTTLRSGLRCRKSVCLSVSVVCNVRAPYSWRLKLFFAILYISHHPLTSVQNFTEIIRGEPIRRCVEIKRGS